MVNKTLEELVVQDTLTDPGGTTHTGTISSGGGSNTSWGYNGTVPASHHVLLYVQSVAADGTFSVPTVTALAADGTPLVSGVEINIGVLDSSGSVDVTNTLVTGDGSTQYIASDTSGSYTNESGSEESVAVIVQNTNSNDSTIFTSGSVSEA